MSAKNIILKASCSAHHNLISIHAKYVAGTLVYSYILQEPALSQAHKAKLGVSYGITYDLLN